MPIPMTSDSDQWSPLPAVLSRQALLAVLLMTLGACAQLPEPVTPASLRDNASLGLPAGAAATPVNADWWREFGDVQLDQLVARALKDNPTMKLAQARLARAQAAAALTDSAARPQLNGSLDLTHQRFTATGLYPPPLAGSVQDTGTLQLGGQWEIDFFGKNRAALDAALGQAKAAAADGQAARVLLASSVVRSYLQVARLNDQLGVAQRSLAQREETLGLVRDRLRAGLDTRLELTQSEGGLPEARQQIESLQEQRMLAQHALAALVGQPLETVTTSLPTLAGLQFAPGPQVLDADLLGQRADIVAARWRVEAATHDRASARAQFYPNINLVGFAGLSSIGLGRLLQTGSQQWGVGPAVRLPIFDGGRLRANLAGKNAELDAAIESYNAAVIDAIHDVADQLASAASLARQQTELKASLQAAETAWDIARQRYKAGLGNYLNVLGAESAVLAQRRQALELASRALDTRVMLIRALGGGFRGSALADTAHSRNPLPQDNAS
jgi:NodT family efflux transporter outer membrane factor (OMF) lipoprotein